MMWSWHDAAAKRRLTPLGTFAFIREPVSSHHKYLHEAASSRAASVMPRIQPQNSFDSHTAQKPQAVRRRVSALPPKSRCQQLAAIDAAHFKGCCSALFPANPLIPTAQGALGREWPRAAAPAACAMRAGMRKHKLPRDSSFQLRRQHQTNVYQFFLSNAESAGARAACSRSAFRWRGSQPARG